MGKVTIIPQKINPVTRIAHDVIKKRRVDPFLKTSKLVNDGECKMERYHLLMLIF